ncbi:MULTISPECIES: AAA family ATPase [unclassified Coleofasciculus]|uniref:AAA family ATPase n=1 Tax=unclassified Coleofasciculus TaxID=2692782 RepID=UPI00187FA69A|nr:MULTISPECIES: ATP-binding protein [unclassified Coleofasciculus]MBE9130087.1 AAA family ATPase [Coleofasciculus sp. LEGE 07081]MBE9152426.1 AAA family ATPase [Coleofasciculus sp. LEGE 07092]
MLHHFLIGTPSSGKSTLAAFLHQLEPNSVIISTDAIRARLFGDENIQGDWLLIEKDVFSQMHTAFLAGQSVIYDATNAKPEWRKSILNSVSGEQVQWLAWHLQTPLELCLLWNQQRQRQVPDAVIIEFYRSLRDFPPQVSEGFVAVNGVKVTPEGIDFDEVVRLWGREMC